VQFWLSTAIAVASLGGCIPVDAECASDAACTTGAICTDNSECSAPADAPSWRITWTVNGAAVSLDEPGDCTVIEDLAVRVTSPAGTDDLNFRPVRCELGQFEFRALPLRFSQVRLEAFDASGLAATTGSSRDGDITTLDLVF